MDKSSWGNLSTTARENDIPAAEGTMNTVRSTSCGPGTGRGAALTERMESFDRHHVSEAAEM